MEYVLEKGPLVADSAHTMPNLSLVAVSLAELAHQRHKQIGTGLVAFKIR